MTDYWLSTKSPSAMFRPSYCTDEADALLHATKGVDPTLLVADLGLSSATIRAYQRRLGVRPVSNPRKAI